MDQEKYNQAWHDAYGDLAEVPQDWPSADVWVDNFEDDMLL